MILTDGDLDGIRADALSVLPDWAYLYANVPVSDDAGGWDDAWHPVWTGRGRVAPMAADERAFAEALVTVADMVATLPWDCPVTERHHLSIRGVTYDIVGVQRGGSYALHTRAAVVARR